MAIKLNSGTMIQTPVILFGTPEVPTTLDATWSFTKTPFFYYKRGEPAAEFGALTHFIDQVDALGVTYSQPRDAYNICQTLAAVGWHSAEYFQEPNEGYYLIQNILQHVVWVVGGIDTGGIGMCKFADSGKYGYIGFDGVFTEETVEPGETEHVYYGFFSSAYNSGDLRGGEFSRREIENGAWCWYTETESTSPPIWMFYTPDDRYWEYVTHFENITPELPLPTNSSIWSTEPAHASEAMSNSNWFSIGLLKNDKIPEQPFICVEPSKGYVKIADHLRREGYSQEGDIYGNGKIDPTYNPFNNVDDNKESGGDGSWDGNSDQGGYTTPDQFETDALNSGFFTVYNPTKGEVQDFNDYLFLDIDDSMATQLKRLIADPIDYVVFLAMCHFSPPVQSGKKAIKFCGLDSGVDSLVVSQQMHQINCGSIEIADETGSFLSYAPYYKIRAFLPYIGFVDLSTDDLVGGAVNILYTIDLLTGSCIAQLTVQRTTKRCSTDIVNSEGITVACYNGNVYQHLPLSATDWRGLYQGIIQFAGATASVATGNAAGLGAMASAVIGDKVGVERSGSMGSNYGYLGFQKPYLLMERTNIAMPVNAYGAFEGWMANISDKIGNFKGLTKVRTDCWWSGTFSTALNGITEEESQMLRDIFATGVYLNWEDLT